MINNYLSSFESYLPEDTREEVRAELEASILEEVDDMQENLGRELSTQEQENYCLKLGHPMRVASNYLPNQELIGHDYFPAYKKALEISLLAFSLIILLTSVSLNFEDLSIIGFIFNVFWRVVETSLDVFVVVTIIFYLLQKSNFDLDKLYAWSPGDLREGVKKVSLGRFNCFFEMMFEGLFLVFWNHLFYSDQILLDFDIVQNVSLSVEWQSVHWIINILVGVSILLNGFHFIAGHLNKWSIKLNILNNLVSIMVLVFIASFDKFVVIEFTDLKNLNWINIIENINVNIFILLGFIGAVAIWDTFTNIKRLRVH